MSRKLSTSLFIFPLCLLTGCAAGEKTAGLTVVYGAAAVLALLLLVGYCGAVRKKNLWIGVLFASVTVVNLGYFLLALSRNLEQALLANRLTYLGSVLLPVAMLMILLRTFFEVHKGWHIQYNIVSRETLLEAKKHPDQYRDLVVRVAGYSAFFTALSPDAQDDIIARTEHML